MVECTGAPSLFDPASGCGDAGTRLAGVYRHPDRGGGKVDPVFLRHLCQSKRVGGGGEKDRGSTVADPIDALQRALRTAGYHHRPECLGRFEASPESDERTESEGRENDVVTIETGRPVDFLPAANEPRPSAIRV